jgi:aerobic carbon-monoxide dehydrogenase large subunit
MRLVGESVRRVEDRRILTGRGRYVDDVKVTNMLHAAFVRSPLAHAHIRGIATSAASSSPGVVAVLTGEDVRALSHPIASAFLPGLPKWPTFYALAYDKARFVGDLVAIVVAESRYQAEDACELVEVDYEPLRAVASDTDALDPGRPLLFEDLGDNVFALNEPATFGDVEGVFAGADRVVTATLRQHRVANVPMETRGGVADYDPSSGELTYYASTQNPHGLRIQLAATIGHPMERLRVVANDVGGGFGLKGNVGREDFCLALVAKQVGRPVKWIEDRGEHLLASGHAREETVEAEMAVNDDGTVLGIKVRLVMDAGAYPNVPFPSTMFPVSMQMMLPGPYRVKGYSFQSSVVCTNKAPYSAYRGPWAVETWVRERLLDMVAHELGIDPAEVRRRNMVSGDPDDRLITGLSLAGVSSRQSLDRALELVDYEAFRKEQAAARGQERYLGIGFATFIEAAPGPPEMRIGGGFYARERAKVALQPDGHLVVTTSQTPHGQGHETTLAQVAAEDMGVPLEHVRVVYGDTRQAPMTVIGTGASRAATWASGAVMIATRKLKEQVLAIASGLLEVSPEDLEIVGGQVTPKGVPRRAIPLAQIAMRALMDPGNLPAGVDPSLEIDEVFTGERITGSGWSGGTHVCTVEVDASTGRVRILRYLVVEDCGQVINPAIVEGQVRGGVAQGIGEVLYEHAAYDRDGNFLAGSFMDYLLPTTAEIPSIEIDHLETEAEGEFGFRGVGEGGAIVAPATLTNAIDDALQPFGVRLCEQHLPPVRVLELAGVVAPAEL